MFPFATTGPVPLDSTTRRFVPPLLTVSMIAMWLEASPSSPFQMRRSLG